jgi:hypothetical protein
MIQFFNMQVLTQVLLATHDKQSEADLDLRRLIFVRELLFLRACNGSMLARSVTKPSRDAQGSPDGGFVRQNGLLFPKIH